MLVRGDYLTTLYIDVFFLINFTVDILAAFLAVKFLRVKTDIARLILVGIFGAVSACLDVFIENKALGALNMAAFLVVFMLIIARGLSISRRIKACLAFILSEIMLGGTVSLGYTLLDKYLSPYLVGGSGAESRSALIFSLLILMAIGVLRLIMFLFSGTGTEKSVKLRIEIENKAVEAEALVDSGNLVRDPMNMYPVLFIKKSLAREILPENVIELCSVDTIQDVYKKRIRLIPVSRLGKTHVMTGVFPDKVSIVEKNEEISVTLAIDKEGGSFGGYYALMPSSAINDVI